MRSGKAGDRYHFQLRFTLSELCERCSKSLPTRDALMMRAVSFGFRKEEFTLLKTNSLGPYSDGVVEALASWLGLQPHEFVELTPEPLAYLRNFGSDVLVHGWESMVLWLTNNQEYVVHQRSYLQTEKDVRRAARDLLLALGWQIEQEQASGGEAIGDDEILLERALKRIAFASESDYEELLLSWWRVNPLVCMSAYDLSETRCGATVLLPLGEETYEAIRRGSKGERDITEAEILQGSTRFLVLGGSDLGHKIRPKKLAASTRSVAGCFLAQLARAVPEGAENKMCGISPAVTAVARARLEANGYAPLDASMPRMTAQLYELDAATVVRTNLNLAVERARRWLDNPRASRKSRP